MSEKQRWVIVVSFAAAMAWMESATVLYLRTLVGRIDPFRADPLPVSAGLGQTELIREAATLLMLLSVGLLAGRTRRSRLAYALVAFGVCDLLYYVFLAGIAGWPKSLLDWDMLFLIPLPWWGPVLAPTTIAAMMILGGTLVSQFDEPERPVWPARRACVLSLIGVLLALYVFMTDAIGALSGGAQAVRSTLPTQFNWLLFGMALALMAAPVVDVSRYVRRSG